jgi:hypothetical protein
MDYDTVLVERGDPKTLSTEEKSRFGQFWSAEGEFTLTSFKCTLQEVYNVELPRQITIRVQNGLRFPP